MSSKFILRIWPAFELVYCSTMYVECIVLKAALLETLKIQKYEFEICLEEFV